jgi:hypothetical protein
MMPARRFAGIMQHRYASETSFAEILVDDGDHFPAGAARDIDDDAGVFAAAVQRDLGYARSHMWRDCHTKRLHAAFARDCRAADAKAFAPPRTTIQR